MKPYIALREEYDTSFSDIPLSASKCEEIKDMFSVDDERSEFVPVGHPLYFQFWAHQWTDSVSIDGQMFNRYNFKDDGQGVYPMRDLDSNLIDRATGKFVLKDGGLPVLVSDGRQTETAPDNHRVNENKLLTAFHLVYVKLHNRLIDDGADYYTAKARNLAQMNRATLDESLFLCDMEEDEFFNDVRIENMHETLEFNFGAARWAHVQMPDTVNGRGIFDRVMNSSDVDMVSLFDGSEMARKLNLGVSTAMTEMFHVVKPHNILDRTFKRNNELGLLNAEDMAGIMGIQLDKDLLSGYPQMRNAPIWPFILFEAQFNSREGRLGPLGRRIVADGIRGTLMNDHGKGLWHDWILPNDSNLNINLNNINYAFDLN